MERRSSLIALFGSVTVAFAAPAPAQTLELAPITVDLVAGRLASTIRVTNRGDQPTTVQVRPFAWSQPAGEERLDPTGDLLVSPPFSTIAPGETQTIRLVLRKPVEAQEASYRLLVDQLPAAAAPGSVRVALRISLPVFAAAAALAKPVLGWTYAPGAIGHGTLTLRNTGTRRARISDLRLTSPDGVLDAAGFTFRYVLAGSTVAIPLRVHLGSGRSSIASLRAAAASDQGKVESNVSLAPSP